MQRTAHAKATACVVVLLLASTLTAQVQPNSAAATLLVDGVEAPGFGNRVPRLLAVGDVVIVEVSGPPGSPFLVAVGPAREPGIPLTVGILNLDPALSTIIADGTMYPLLTIPPSGTLIAGGAVGGVPIGATLAMQVGVLTGGNLTLTAPARSAWVPGDPVPASLSARTMDGGHPAGNRHAAVGMIDGDLNLDLADSAAIWLGDGQYGFTYASIDPGGVEAALADLVGTPDLDLVIMDDIFLGLKIYPGNGTGSFGTPTQMPVFCNDRGHVEVVDLDGGGTPDLLVATGDTSSAGVLRFENLGGGAFFQVGATWYDDAHAVTSGDFNGDTLVDLVVSGVDLSSGTEETRILWGPAPHDVGNSTVLTAQPQPGSRWLGTAHLNADAHLDLVWAGTSAQGALLNDGTGGFTWSPCTVGPANGFFYPRIDAGDVDNDGDVDLVWVDLSTPLTYLCVAANDGAGGFPTTWYVPTMSPSSSNGGFAMPADLDGDGDDDLIVGGSPVTVFVNDG